jgi:hypothetical protein
LSQPRGQNTRRPMNSEREAKACSTEN